MYISHFWWFVFTSSFQLSILCVFFISFFRLICRDIISLANTHKYKKQGEKFVAKEIWVLLWGSNGQLANSKQLSNQSLRLCELFMHNLCWLGHLVRKGDQSVAGGKNIVSPWSVLLFFALEGVLIQLITLVEISCDVKLILLCSRIRYKNSLTILS